MVKVLQAVLVLRSVRWVYVLMASLMQDTPWLRVYMNMLANTRSACDMRSHRA